MDVSMWWKIALLTFLAVGTVTIIISGFRRCSASRKYPDLSAPLEARYGSTMAGNWTRPIENNRQITVERVDDPDDPLGKITH